MIELDCTNKQGFVYFSCDGSWGDASDILIINDTELDSHYVEMMDEIGDYDRVNFMRWYVENQSHDQQQGDYTACEICERWQDGTEEEIQEDIL